MNYPNLTLQVIDSHKVPHAGIFTITPTVAAAILKDRNPNNRHVSPAKMTQTAHDVANGEFVLNGEAIIFSNAGKLIDGQHRLYAMLKGAKPITSVVTMGMPPEVRDTVDQGKSRSARDVLCLNGYVNGNELASIGRHLLGYYDSDGTGFGRTTEYSNTEVIDWIEAHPNINDITAWAVTLKGPMLGYASATMMALTRAILEPKYGTPMVTNFLERVAYGDNIDKTHPAYAVRRKLQTERIVLAKDRRRVTNIVGVEILMRGFLAHYHGRQLSNMKLMGALPIINKTARAATAAAAAPATSEAALSLI